jgi:chromosome segregation ATPase
LFQEYLTEPLLDKVAILDSTIETLEKERNEFATEKSALDKQMSQIMTQVKVMIEEERVKANKRIEEDLAKADEKLAGELAKANKRIDELQSELHSSNDRADEMSFKLQEVDASEVTMVTLEWISLGVHPWSN